VEQNEILLLIEKYLGGVATSEEQKRLLDWYRSYTRDEIEIHFDSQMEHHETKHRLLQKLKTHIDATRVAEAEPLIDRHFRIRRRIVRWAAASIVVLLLATGYWLLILKPSASFKRSDNTVSENKAIIITKPGFKTDITLPDGSHVWLNADSKITHSKYFKGTAREVFLTGEAYFDVVKDNSRPFIVHTHTIDLKVLGTAFNVRAYEDEKETETSLVHGSVEVTVKNNPAKKIILKPSEKLVVKNQVTDTVQSKKIEEEKPFIAISKMRYYGRDSSAVETSWVKNRLVFSKENLDEIALKIERWFNVKVTITDASLKDSKYNGVFEDETLEEVMEALRLTGNFHYTIKGVQVIISR
jgi:ferric-dicitrate binding protein FerR (iron transport regulator)